MSDPFLAFYRAHRKQMVRYAGRVLASRGARGTELAEDAVQDATLYYLSRNEPWCERRYVGAIRFAALRSSVVAAHVFEIRNTATGARGKKKRSRVTNFFPNQVFGVQL